MKGAVGFRFQNVPKSSQEHLERWLDDRLEQELPGAKERLVAPGSESIN